MQYEMVISYDVSSRVSNGWLIYGSPIFVGDTPGMMTGMYQAMILPNGSDINQHVV